MSEEHSTSAPEQWAEPPFTAVLTGRPRVPGRWADSLMGVNIGTCTMLTSEPIQWGEGRTGMPRGARITLSTFPRAVDQAHTRCGEKGRCLEGFGLRNWSDFSGWRRVRAAQKRYVHLCRTGLPGRAKGRSWGWGPKDYFWEIWMKESR